MPVQYEIQHEARFVYARAHGVVVLQDILEYFDAISIQNAASYRKLFDGRDAIPDLSDEDFMVLAARDSAYALFSPRGAVALVATTGEAATAFRRYANFASGDGRPTRLFQSIKEAHQWLETQNEISPKP